MTGPGESLRAVKLTVEAEKVEGLLAHLGNYAVGNDLGIAVSDPETVQPDFSRFNPDLVTIMLADSGEQIPVITSSLIHTFAQSRSNEHIALRFDSQLFDARKARKLTYLNEYVYRTKPDTFALGLRAERVEHLYDLLTQGLNIPMIGHGCIVLLGEICDKLYVKPDGSLDMPQ